MRGARSPASSTRKCDAIWSPDKHAIRAQRAYPFLPLARLKGWEGTYGDQHGRLHNGLFSRRARR
jgi:hypothetical protein